MSDELTVRMLRTRLEHGEATAAHAVATLAVWAVEAPTRATRLDACRLLGELAGRALGAEWEPASPASVPRERIVALAHRLHTLAAVRNLVTHRASAGAATLAAFRHSYDAAFEDLVALA